jgi:hypothetical protein
MKVLLILGLAFFPAAWATSASPLPPATDRELARDLLKTLVEINTTHAHGSTEADQCDVRRASAFQPCWRRSGCKSPALSSSLL